MNCPQRQGDINMSTPFHFSMSLSILLLISLSPFFYISQSILILVSIYMCIHSSLSLSQSLSSLCSSVFAAATSPSPSLAPHTSLFLFTSTFSLKGNHCTTVWWGTSCSQSTSASSSRCVLWGRWWWWWWCGQINGQGNLRSVVVTHIPARRTTHTHTGTAWSKSWLPSVLFFCFSVCNTQMHAHTHTRCHVT